MIDERIVELYCSQLAAANEEKGMLYAQVKALTEELSMLRSSMQDTSKRIDEFLSEIKSLHDTLKAKDKRISDLEKQLSDALEPFQSSMYGASGLEAESPMLLQTIRFRCPCLPCVQEYCHCG